MVTISRGFENVEKASANMDDEKARRAFLKAVEEIESRSFLM